MADADDSPLFEEVQDSAPKESMPVKPEGEQEKGDGEEEAPSKNENAEGSPASISVKLESESTPSKDLKVISFDHGATTIDLSFMSKKVRVLFYCLI